MPVAGERRLLSRQSRGVRARSPGVKGGFKNYKNVRDRFQLAVQRCLLPIEPECPCPILLMVIARLRCIGSRPISGEGSSSIALGLSLCPAPPGGYGFWCLCGRVIIGRLLFGYVWLFDVPSLCVLRVAFFCYFVACDFP